MLKYIYIILLIFILLPNLSFGQGQAYEPVYSQYWVNGLAINPAYTGSRECFSNTILYRNQWMGFPGAPVTQTLSSHAPFKDQKNAAGLFLFHEQIGVSDYIDIYANYAFRFQFAGGKLSLGLKAGATLFQGNYSDLIASPDDITNASDGALIDESATIPNFGVGAYYYNDKYFIGLSVPKLLTHELKISPNNYDFLLTGGYLFKFNEKLKFKPSFLLRYRFDNTYQVDISANTIWFDALWVGGSYRVGNDVAAMVEYQVSNQIRAGVAYDFSLGEFSSQHSGSLELVLRYEFKYKIRAVSPRYF